MPVSGATRDAYRRHGFAVVRGLLDADEVAHWRAVLDDAVAARDSWLPGRAPIGGAHYQRVFTQRVDLRRTDAAAGRLATSPRLGALAADLAGVDAVRLAHDQALYKRGGAPATALHVDGPYWSFDDPRAVTLWIALDDADADAGCLVVLPGTHDPPRDDSVPIGPDWDALLAVHPDWRAVTPVEVPVRAGDAVALNAYLAHGARANRGAGCRRAFSVAVFPDGAVFNGQQNVLTDADVARLTVGAPLDDPAATPLLWPRPAGPGGR